MSLFSPILLSVRVAFLATAFTLVVGLGLARLFASRAVPLRRIWEALILLPMVFPPTITGYLLLVALGKRSPLGALLSQLGLSVVFTWTAAVIASFVVSLPLMFQNCKAALRRRGSPAGGRGPHPWSAERSGCSSASPSPWPRRAS